MIKKIKLLAYYSEYVATLAKYIAECAKNFPVLPEKPIDNETPL